jgi:hypothetical protein
MIAFVLTVLKWALVGFISYQTVRRLWRARSRAHAEGRAMPAPLTAALRRLAGAVVATLLSAGGMLLNIGIPGLNHRRLDNSLIAVFLLSCIWMTVAIAQVGIRAYKAELGVLEDEREGSKNR